MRVLEQRFLRGPNIYRMAPCFMSVLELEAYPAFAGEARQGSADFLRPLLSDSSLPVSLEGAKAAALVARLMASAQGWAGTPVTFCETVSLTPTAPQRLRLLCSYDDEAVAEAALRLSVDCVKALFYQQPFNLESRLVELRTLADGRAIAPAARLLSSTRAAGIPRIPVVAVTGTNGKTTTTRLIDHVLRACGARTGATTTQGIYIDGECVESGDCAGFLSAQRVLSDLTVEVATLETARGGILKRGLAFDRCDVGVVLNISSDHLGLDGVETLQDLAHVKGLVARCASRAAVLNADDALCVAMRDTLLPECRPVFFAMNQNNPVLLEHLLRGGAGAFLDDDGWLVWCHAGERSKVVRAVDLPFTFKGHARYNTANALAALAALHCLGYSTAPIGEPMTRFVATPKTNPLRGNLFEVDGVTLIVDYAHNVVAYRALCDMARSLHKGAGRLVGVITSPGDRRCKDLYETGEVCGKGFDELVVYEQHPRGRVAGATTQEILRGARHAAPGKPLHGEPRIRQALWRGLTAARPGDVLVFTCAGSFDDLVEGVRLKNPDAAERIAREVSR